MKKHIPESEKQHRSTLLSLSFNHNIRTHYRGQNAILKHKPMFVSQRWSTFKLNQSSCFEWPHWDKFRSENSILNHIKGLTCEQTQGRTALKIMQIVPVKSFVQAPLHRTQSIKQETWKKTKLTSGVWNSSVKTALELFSLNLESRFIYGNLCIDSISMTFLCKFLVHPCICRVRSIYPYLNGVSHENQEGSKVVLIERSSFKDVSAGSFWYFQSGSFKSAKNYSATYNRKKLAFSS